MRRPYFLLLGALLAPNVSFAQNPWPGLDAELERSLEKPQVQERRVAARRIAELSPGLAKAALEKAINDRDTEVRLIGLRTARAFNWHQLGDVAIESLKSPDVRERVEAVRLVALEPSEDGVAALEAVSSDADAIVRREVAEGLGKVPKSYAARAAAKLLSMLDDVDATVRVEVAAALGRLAEPTASLALAAHLKDQDAQVRTQVALALGAIGSNTAVPALQVALLDADAAVVAAVVRALGSIESQDAIVGLVAIAEESPKLQQGEEAIEALVRLSHIPSVKERLLDMLESSEHRVVLGRMLNEGVPGAAAVVTECLKRTSAEIALLCARASRRWNRDLSLVVRAQEEGRLSSLSALEVLAGVSFRSAVILALEQLSLGKSVEFDAALEYLGGLAEIPAEAEQPLLEALRAPARKTEDVASLLLLLGEVKGGDIRPLLSSYLEATHDDVRSAAAEALTRRGASSRELESYLKGERPIAIGALRGLAKGMSTSQAEVLIRLVASGRSGRRSSLLSVFFAMPEKLPKKSVAQLLDLFRSSKGSDRDSLLYPLMMSGDREVLRAALKNAKTADRLKMAQLSWYRPETRSIVLELIKDDDPNVAALAAQSLGKIGTAQDAEVLAELAKSGPTYSTRAAAVRAIYFLVKRGKLEVVPESLLSRQTCSSRHDALRAETTRLAASVKRKCAGKELSDVLRRDPDPRFRRLAASLLTHSRPEDPSLRTCRFYENRLEVAEACEVRLPRVVHEVPPTIPFGVELVLARGETLKLMPYAVRASASALGEVQAPDFALNLYTDRGGLVILPWNSSDTVDADWFF